METESKAGITNTHDKAPESGQGSGQATQRTFQGLGGRWAMFIMGYGTILGVLTYLMSSLADYNPILWLFLNGVLIATGLGLAQRHALLPFLRRAGSFAKATFLTWICFTLFILFSAFAEDLMPTLQFFLSVGFFFGMVLFPAHLQARILEKENIDGLGWVLFHGLAILAGIGGIIISFRLLVERLGGFRVLALQQAKAFESVDINELVFGLAINLLMLTLYSAISGAYLEHICAKSLREPGAHDRQPPPGREFSEHYDWLGIVPVVLVGLFLSVVGLVVGLRVL